MLIQLHGGPNDGQELEVPDDTERLYPPHPDQVEVPPACYMPDDAGVWRVLS